MTLEQTLYTILGITFIISVLFLIGCLRVSGRCSEIERIEEEENESYANHNKQLRDKYPKP